MALVYAKDQPQGFSNTIEKIAFVGAGGQVGKYLVEPLLKTGKHVVTAITRPGSSSKLPDGLKIVKVDYNDDDDTELVEALRGQQALIITMSLAAPPDTISKLSKAAAKAGIPYVLPNWLGIDDGNIPLCDGVTLSQSREKIQTQFKSFVDTSYIFLVCSFWYEFSLGGGPYRYGFDFKNRSFIQFDDGTVKIPTTTWPQCGRAIASLLSLKNLPDDENDKSPTVSHFANASVYVTSFRVNQLEMFESAKRVTGTTDADWTITHETAEARWTDGHEAVHKGNYALFPKMLYSRMFFPNGDGAVLTSEVHNDILGLPVEDLDEYTAIAIRMSENDELAETH
ncbi:NAD(P)-binding protein [Penicillium angulare]|uniref:NAD(P)-binding protein n=1 Tax=Penicillium angulare TaxID=116970 RepID=UPI0025419CA3|nr:NAD(P)-binding protein [Penicillium angulare]KAJ5279291.1 NAD(P)-binding protein [Penicillium angulare]